MNKTNYITDEAVTLYVKAIINNRESNDFIRKVANEAVANGGSLPEALADLFTLEIVTRPSGSKYGVLDFA